MEETEEILLPEEAQPKELPKQISIDYIKSNHFRVIHSDGVIGGITPQLKIHMAFFSERQAIPQKEIYPITSEGNLGEVIRSTKRSEVVREVETDIVVDLLVAKSFHSWLTEKIRTLESHLEMEDDDGV